jgi:hypothetical protein
LLCRSQTLCHHTMLLQDSLLSGHKWWPSKSIIFSFWLFLNLLDLGFEFHCHRWLAGLVMGAVNACHVRSNERYITRVIACVSLVSLLTWALATFLAGFIYICFLSVTENFVRYPPTFISSERVGQSSRSHCFFYFLYFDVYTIITPWCLADKILFA